MRLIKQEHKTGCGVAVIAALGNVSYKKALAIIHPNYKRKKKFYTSWKQISKALDAFGIKHGIRIKSTDDTKNRTFIASVADKRGQRNWHYVIIRNGKVFDPAFGKYVDKQFWKIIRSMMEINS